MLSAGVVTSPNGFVVTGLGLLGVGVVSDSLNLPNRLLVAGVGVGTVSGILNTLSELAVAGLGVGALPKSMGRVEGPEVLGTT